MSTETLSRSTAEIRRAEGLAVLAWLNDLDLPDPADRLAAVRGLGTLCAGNDDPIVIQALTERLTDASAAVRCAAIAALATIGRWTTSSQAKVADLTRDLDADVRVAAVSALGSAGDDVVPVLTDALADTDPAVRVAALDALCQFGPQSRSASARVLPLTCDADDAVRAAALTLLAEAAVDVESAVILPRLDDADPAVRRSAIRLLAATSATVVRHRDALCRMLTDVDAQVRLSAASALRHAGPASLDGLHAAMRDPSTLVRQAARAAIAGVTETSRPWMPYLLQIRQALGDDDGTNLGHIDDLIARGIDPADAASSQISFVAAYFSEILDHANEVVVWNAGIGLSAVGPAAAIGAPKLLELLSSGLTHLRVCGVCGFLTMGPVALQWLDALVQRAADRDPLVRQLAIMAIGGIGPSAAVAAPRLRAAMNDPEADVRTAAATAPAAIERSSNDMTSLVP